MDIFFVISGYLIAGIILADLDAGRFTFRKFYERRIRRILPALAVMAVVCTAVSCAILPPVMQRHFGSSMASMAAFGSNVYFATLPKSGGYFAVAPEPQPLLHTWSLAVEEQFYLVLPVLLLLLSRMRRMVLWVVLALLALVSLRWSAHQVHLDAVRAFYLAPSRAWELLCGALLLALPRPAARWRIAAECLAVAGLAMIAYPLVHYTGATLFPGKAALWPCLGCAALLYAGSGERTCTARLLGCQPLLFFGVISYSLYLWHWPVLVFATYLVQATGGNALTGWSLAIALLCSLVFGTLSYAFVERPFRSAHPVFTGRRLLWFGACTTGALLAMGLTLVWADGMPGRFSPHAKWSLEQNAERERQIPDTRDYSPESFPGVPELQAATVSLGKQPGQPNILFWGDSHMMQMAPLIAQMEKRGEFGQHGVVMALDPGCPLSEKLGSVSDNLSCRAKVHAALLRAAMPDIDTVQIEFLPWWLWSQDLCALEDDHCGRTLPKPQAIDILLGELETNIQTWRAAGKRVIIGLPFPAYGVNIPRYEEARLTVPWLVAAQMPQSGPDKDLRARLKAMAQRTGSEIFDPRITICPNGNCVIARDDVAIYSDGNHLVPSAAAALEENLRNTLAEKQSPSQR